MHEVTATDESGHDFEAVTKHPNPDAEQHVNVWVYIDGENGWNANVGELTMLKLKKLDDGKFGS